jgi:hypothetical protein
MLELVRRARRRLLNSELMSQGANAFSAALAAFILLLILGTEILAWYWLALIPLAAAGVGVYLALRSVPSPYRTAQLVDHRADLADTISTALYFSKEDAAISSDVKRWQQQRAEEAAQRVDLPRIFPYLMPRSAYIVAALALVATSLFGLRYGLSKRLDLTPALAHMIHDQFTPADKKEVAENRRRTPPGKDDADTSDSASQDQSQQGQDQQNAEDPASQGDAQSGEKNGDSKEQPGKPKSGEQNQDGQGQNQQADDQNQQQDSSQQSSGSQGDSKGDAKQQADGKQQSQSGESGSLLSKMKDFAENLLSKMKPQQQQDKSNSPQQSSSQNSKQGQGQQQKGQQQKSQDGQQGSSDQADAQQGQNGDEKDGQQSQGKGSGEKSPQQNKQPGSGVGSEDGDKAIKRAEQLAAMGKITELVGKRSATVTGESTVEVQNTSQQLHTAYVQRGAQHQQTGAQIDRDEIPVALQPYVEQYFDQVRKNPAAMTPAAPVAGKKQ